MVSSPRPLNTFGTAIENQFVLAAHLVEVKPAANWSDSQRSAISSAADPGFLLIIRRSIDGDQLPRLPLPRVPGPVATDLRR